MKGTVAVAVVEQGFAGYLEAAAEVFVGDAGSASSEGCMVGRSDCHHGVVG